MRKTVTIDVTGDSPLLMHNIAYLADPISDISKAIKAISSKKNKTDEDHEQMARWEYLGSLYLDDTGPVMPTINFERSIVQAARLQKNGKNFERGFGFDEISVPLIYDGPRDFEGLWADKNFRLVAFAKVGQARVKRTRPMFRDWSFTVTGWVDSTLLNDNVVTETIEAAGTLIGLGDWRPRYGRFRAKVTIK